MKFYTLFANGESRISSGSEIADIKPDNDLQLVVSSITEAQKYLKSIDVEDIISWIDAVSLSWSNRDSEIQKLYSNHGLNFLIYWFRKQHLIEITDFSLRGNKNFLDKFCEVDGMGVKLSAHPRGVVSHWISGNVPMLGMLSLIQGIITKNANLVKVSKENFHVLPTLLNSMSKVNISTSQGKILEGKEIVKSISCIYYDSSNKNALSEMSFLSKVRVAWGGLEAIESIINLPRKFGCEDIVFGPKTSFMVIGSEQLTDKIAAKNIARKASIDASQFEQQGCNAPHTIFVEKGGAVSPLEFSELLAKEMDKTSRRIIRDKDTIPDIGKILTLRAKYDMFGEAFYSKGLEWSVLYSDEDVGLMEPCYFRTLFVQPTSDIMNVVKFCSHFTQTAGVALSNKRKEEFGLAAASKGIDRIPDVGAMTAYEVPWDGLFMLDRLVRWCKLS